MKMFNKIKYIFVVCSAFFIFTSNASAATLELALESGITSTKSDVVVLVTLNSEDQNVNTAQASISFPPGLLEVTNIDKSDSVISFWLEEPSYDNKIGHISFVGGSTTGFSGASLKIMKINFRVKGSGTGRLAVSDGAITASDGTGSNVYNTAKGLDINIPATSEFQAVKVERATQAATLAKKLPSVPTVDIPFYPNQTKWNNRSASFQAKWDIGSDITKAAYILDNMPNTIPKESAEALSGSKIFSALKDGVWYLHLRFANNIGWGPTLHYKIAVDTTPPSIFNIISVDGFKTGNPKPTINYKSSDLTSGIDIYVISIDGKILYTTDQTTYQFPPLLPGVHNISVEAVDKTNNSITENQTLEILPIEPPIISYVSKTAIVDEGGISSGGTSPSNGEVIIQIQNSEKQIIFEESIPVDSKGNWNITINKSLPKGEYTLLATSRDENMASSFPVTSDTITVKQKPMLVIGNLEISQTWFYISLIAVLLCTFGAGWFSYRKWREQLGRRTVIAQRDVMNIMENFKVDINKLLKKHADGTPSESDLAEMEFILKKMRSDLERSHSYIVDNIGDINK